MSEAAKLAILIDIQTRLAALQQTQQALREVHKEANTFGAFLKQGFGIGSGIEIVRRGIDVIKSALSSSVSEAFRMAGQLKDVSQNLQISTDALQVLSALVKDNGGEFQTLTQGIITYRGALAQARAGNGEAAKTFRDLHLSADELARLPLELQLEKVAQAIHKAGSESSAFDAGVQLLGQRNAPKLMQSLKELAAGGYKPLDDAMKESGRVMQRETIDRLDRAQKQIAKFKEWTVTQTGEALGQGSIMIEALNKDFTGVMSLYAKSAASNLVRVKADWTELQTYVRKLTAKPADSDAPSGPKMASVDDVDSARIQRAEQAIGMIAGNPVLTEIEQRRLLLPLLKQQVSLYRELLKSQFPDSTDLTVKAATGILTEAELSRFKEYLALLTQLEAKENAATAAAGGQSGAFKRVKEAFGGVDNPKENPNAMSASDGVVAGFMQWGAQMGSVGEQIAGTINGTIGGAVSMLSDGIHGLITGTKSWGDVGRAAGNMFLQALIQLGVQMAVNAAISMAFGKKKEAADVKEIGMEATKGGFKSIAQLGPIFGPLAFAASIAAIMALIGGFRADGGPVQAGVPYVVGERRAEVFVPNQSGMIVPSVGEFTRTSPGLGASTGATTVRPRMFLMRPSTEQDFDAMRRLAGWDVQVVDTVMRHRGEILNS